VWPSRSATTPSWRDRVNRRESQAQGGARWIPSETEEHSQRREPPVRRWRSPEPPLRWRKSELDSSSVSRSWAQRHQDPHPLLAPRSLTVSRLGGGHTPGPVVYERRNSEDATKDARSTRRQWAPNASHDDDDIDDDDDVDDDDDDGDDDDEEEDSDEQSNFTLKHRLPPPPRSYERWHNVKADHRLQRTHGPFPLSHDDHVGVLRNQVPSWSARRQLSRIAEMPAGRWSQSDNCSQDSQSETPQDRATQSLTTSAVDVQSDQIRPTRRNTVDTGKSVTSVVRRPPHTFQAGQAPSLVDKHDERFDSGEDIRSESNAHSTSNRRLSAFGKRKETLAHNEAIFYCGHEPGEVLEAIEPQVSECNSGIGKTRNDGTRKRYRKRCQYPEGCDKGTIGPTLRCKAHGGGKRCQYPEGCGKSAKGSTMLCIAHGGGKRCQYLEGCDKSTLGSTMFCSAHGGGKRCQYPDGCGKGAEGQTMFCRAHGGGKRCQYPDGCGKGAEGQTMFCIAHGGGKRCQYPDGCGKSARGSNMFCIAHGGGRRCGHESGCSKLVRRGGLCKSHGADAGV
jgi:hypothetical protein